MDVYAAKCLVDDSVRILAIKTSKFRELNVLCLLKVLQRSTIYTV